MKGCHGKQFAHAGQMLLDFEKWLRSINGSAEDSLRWALENILILQLLKSSGITKGNLDFG